MPVFCISMDYRTKPAKYAEKFTECGKLAAKLEWRLAVGRMKARRKHGDSGGHGRRPRRRDDVLSASMVEGQRERHHGRDVRADLLHGRDARREGRLPGRPRNPGVHERGVLSRPHRALRAVRLRAHLKVLELEEARKGRWRGCFDGTVQSEPQRDRHGARRRGVACRRDRLRPVSFPTGAGGLPMGALFGDLVRAHALRRHFRRNEQRHLREDPQAPFRAARGPRRGR